MHNVQETEESSRGRDGAPTGTEGTSALPSTDAGPGNTADGTWGERDGRLTRDKGTELMLIAIQWEAISIREQQWKSTRR
jgi:hypothetical protein